MKFVTFTLKSAPNDFLQGARLPGVLIDDDHVVDLSPLGYASILSIIEAGAPALELVRSAVPTLNPIAFADVILQAPVTRPPRIFGIGLNYRSHAAESKLDVASVPTVFLKLASSVTGPDHPIVIPAATTQADYEAELAVVICRPGHKVAAADWQSYVFGYTILNDVSARDVQFATSQWTLSKSFPTFAPFGPAIVTADEIPDPHSLDISLSIDGETLQSANTRDLIFKIPELIAYISSIAPIEAGDIISTGTPEGVGLGRTPPRWLKPGEEIVIDITGLGRLRNRTTS